MGGNDVHCVNICWLQGADLVAVLKLAVDGLPWTL